MSAMQDKKHTQSATVAPTSAEDGPEILSIADFRMPDRAEVVSQTVIPGATEDSRLLLEITSDDTVSVHEQSFSSSVGWFTQRRVSIEPGQVQQLRNSLGLVTTFLKEQPPAEPITKVIRGQVNESG